MVSKKPVDKKKVVKKEIKKETKKEVKKVTKKVKEVKKKVDLGSLTSADINFLKDNLGLNFDNDAAAILRGHQAFRDIIYKRQHDRDSFNRSDYNNYKPNEPQDNPYNLFRENQENNFYGENQASSKESSEAIDKLFNQIESNTKQENRIEKEVKPEPKKVIRDSNNKHVTYISNNI